LPAFLLAVLLAFPGAPYLVKDLSTAPQLRDSAPRAFTVAGDVAYFLADTAPNRTALWRTDGTPAGSYSLDDDFGPSLNAVAIGPRLYFMKASELWVTDGTPQGTSLVRALAGEAPHILGAVGDRILFRSGDVLSTLDGPLKEGLSDGWWNGPNFALFTAAGSLWRTDGTPAATFAVGTAPAAPAGASVTSDNILYFIAGDALWRSDGSAIGTHAVTTTGTVTGLALLGDRVFYTRGGELWSNNGGASQLVKALGPAEQTAHSTLIVSAGRLYFAATDFIGGVHVYASDGTAGGTVAIESISLAKTGDPLVVVPFAGGAAVALMLPGGAEELWRTDGSEAGTHRLAIFAPLAAHAAYQLATVNNHLVFGAATPVEGTELWASDGTAEGTRMLRDIWPSNASSSPQLLASAGDRVLFFAYDDAFASAAAAIWATDGSEAGTVRLQDTFSPPLAAGCNGRFLFNNKGRVQTTDGSPSGTFALGPAAAMNSVICSGNAFIFTAAGSLYRSDGTSATLLHDFPSSPAPIALGTFGGQAYVASGNELWAAGGESAIATLPAPIVSMAAGATRFFLLTRTEAWVSDGTSTGTHKLVALPAAATSTAVLGDDLYLVLGDALWRGDGSKVAANVASVLTFHGRLYAVPKDGTTINSEEVVTLPATGAPIVARDRLYFRCAPGICTSDGVTTTPLALGESQPADNTVMAAGATLFYSGQHPWSGIELWAIPLGSSRVVRPVRR
jgi:ELWxxDGT repeat protein